MPLPISNSQVIPIAVVAGWPNLVAMNEDAAPTRTSAENPSRLRNTILRLWIWLVVLTLLLWAYPVAYRVTRLLFVSGIALSWVGILLLWWRKKIVLITWVLITALLLMLVLLPGRPVRAEELAHDYCSGLKLFRGARYIWGGEGLLGIDCSGLVRQGLIWGQVSYGIRRLNGQLIRDALWLWWNDCSARDLCNGAGGMTHECFRADSMLSADYTRLRPGDLAVTADGVHVLAYLGNRTWIEADPALNKVVEIVLPTDNPWFKIPIVFVRWKWLDGAESVPTPSSGKPDSQPRQ